MTSGQEPKPSTAGPAKRPTSIAAAQYITSTHDTAAAATAAPRTPRSTPSRSSSTPIAPNGTATPSPAASPTPNAEAIPATTDMATHYRAESNLAMTNVSAQPVNSQYGRH